MDDQDSHRQQIEDLDRRIALDPGDADALLRRGNVLAKSHEFDRALQDYARAATLNPNSPLPYYNRALIHLERRDFRSAIRDLDVALSISPDDPMTLNNRAVAYRGLEEFDQALRDYDRAISLNQELLGPQIGKANALLAIGAYEGAIQAATEGLSSGSSPPLWRIRAKALLLTNRHADALTDIDALESHGEADAEVNFDRGIALRKLERFDEAVTAFSAVLKEKPNDIEALGQRAWTRAKLRDFGGAENDFRRCIHLAPDDARFAFSLGLVLAEAGRFDDALALVRRAGALGDPEAGNAEAMIVAWASASPAASISQQVIVTDPDCGKTVNSDTSQPEPNPESVTDDRRRAVVYSGRKGYESSLSEALLADLHSAHPPFHANGLAAPPLSRFQESVRFIRFDDLDEVQRAVFTLAFPGFFQESSTPDAERLESALRGLRNAPAFNYRRWAGDGTLPRGRYFSVCRPSSGSGDQTLAHELAAYADPENVGAVNVVDLSDPASAWLLAEYNRFLFVDGSAPSSAVVARFLSRPSAPSRVLDVMSRAKEEGGVNIAEAAPEIPVFIPTRAIPLDVEGILDLRTPAAQQWLLEIVTMGFPDIDYSYGAAGRSPRLFIRGKEPERFADLLPLLMFHFRGGSPILNGIATYLRSRGVHGVVYPSARSNPQVILEDGKLKSWSGWCFVDYRDAPLPEPELRIIQHPDAWCETLASAIRLAPTSDRRAGSWAVEGNVEAAAALRTYHAEFYYQAHYHRPPDEFEARYRGETLIGTHSLVALRAGLRAGYLELDSPVEDITDGELAVSSVGVILATRATAEPDDALEGHFRADTTWFIYRLGLWDAELQIRCAVCDFEELWPVYMGANRVHCPRCGFVGKGEPPESVRKRLLRLFNRG